LNLALNGLDAAAASATPRVTISTVGWEEEVEIVVHDTGPGISVEVKKHLFESFFTTKVDGLGLGLTIVQSIVDRHQGRVRADNAETGGALFRVVVPRNNRVRSPSEVDGLVTPPPVLAAAAASPA
jgi:two-component system sensor kinase FixL